MPNKESCIVHLPKRMIVAALQTAAAQNARLYRKHAERDGEDHILTQTFKQMEYDFSNAHIDETK